jgi:YVTN family beta-propeller protein
MKKIFIGAAIMIASQVNAQQTSYSYYKTIQVGDALGWDYAAVDETNRNVYFSHGTSVLVVAADKDAIIAEIPNTIGVHGIAFDHALNKGFISNGKANSVTVFDLQTFKVEDTVAVTGANPDAVMYDDFSKKVFVFNGKSNNATVIDPATLQVLQTIALPGKPEFAVTDGKGKIYVNIEDKSVLVQLDAAGMRVLNFWPITPGNEPSGLAIDAKNNLLFSVCSNKKLIVFDAAKGKVVESLPIGTKPDAVVFDAAKKLIISSNGEGNATIIQQVRPDSYKVIQTLTTQKGSKTMAMDNTTGKLYLPAAKFEGDTRKIIPGSFEILVYKMM